MPNTRRNVPGLSLSYDMDLGRQSLMISIRRGNKNVAILRCNFSQPPAQSAPCEPCELEPTNRISSLPLMDTYTSDSDPSVVAQVTVVVPGFEWTGFGLAEIKLVCAETDHPHESNSPAAIVSAPASRSRGVATIGGNDDFPILFLKKCCAAP